MLQDANSFNHAGTWAPAALLSGVCVPLYDVVATAEPAVLARFSPRDTGA